MSDDFIHTRCTNQSCNHEYRINKSSIGKTVQCKSCGHSFIVNACVPTISAEEAEAAMKEELRAQARKQEQLAKNVPKSRPPVLDGSKDRWFICPNPNCGYSGIAQRVVRNDKRLFGWIMALVLFLIPGILYLLLCCGDDYVCPRCRMKLASKSILS